MDSKRILIVDDESRVRDVYSSLLAELGFEPVPVATGEEGVTMLEWGGFDLVITDLRLPGISGWDVAKAVKERNPHIPVIILSASDVRKDNNTLKASGIDGILQKPCSIRVLKKKVDEVLRSGEKS